MNKKIFIHIPKNAGCTINMSEDLSNKIISSSSIVHQNKDYSKNVFDNVRILPEDEVLLDHARWIDLDPNITKKYKSFSVIRNPWARAASRYFYALKNYKEGHPVPVNVSSFEAFIEERHYWIQKPYMWHSATRGWYCALDYVTDSDGKLVCDMLSFENLDSDLCDFFALQSPPKRRNITGLGDGKYRDIYNKKTIQIIADWYKKDIDMFGYDFDTGPTKNVWKK